MEKSSKSIVLPPGKQKQILAALDLLAAHYDDLLSIWPQLPQVQRGAILANSPILARLQKMTEALHGG